VRGGRATGVLQRESPLLSSALREADYFREIRRKISPQALKTVLLSSVSKECP
jgi:hypothetical protein